MTFMTILQALGMYRFWPAQAILAVIQGIYGRPWAGLSSLLISNFPGHLLYILSSIILLSYMFYCYLLSLYYILITIILVYILFYTYYFLSYLYLSLYPTLLYSAFIYIIVFKTFVCLFVH